MSDHAIHQTVEKRYAQIAATRASCCAPGAHYSLQELQALPEGAHLGLGTGNPVRAANLQPGETVLDLGCGAGVDVFLAARHVGPTGRAIGIDLTPAMIQRAQQNAQRAGITNVEFHRAPIETIPVADQTVDVVVSNCVINLSPNKPAVLREAFRVLGPGGRLVVSDTLRTGAAPQDACAYNCADGSLAPHEWTQELGAAGFQDAHVEIEGPYAEGVSRGTITARKA